VGVLDALVDHGPPVGLVDLLEPAPHAVVDARLLQVEGAAEPALDELGVDADLDLGRELVGPLL